MIFSENLIFIFIFIFMAMIFLFEYIRKSKNVKIKKIAIIIISSLLILWLDPFSYFLLLFFSIVLFLILKSQISLKKNIYPLSLFLIFTLLCIKDYWIVFDIENPYIPLGISYYFFRLLSLLIDYSKNQKAFKDIKVIDYFTYVFFFPIFLAGPIQRFVDFKELDSEYVEKNLSKFYYMLIMALSLKILIVDTILFPLVYKNLYTTLTTTGVSQYSGLYEFGYISLFGFLAFLHAYLDLMLYTEMSKAISRILGFSIQENFNKPLLATNISKFWQSWHMSLSNWTRDYIFFPTLLKTKKVWLSTYASMMVIGIWHSATLNWILWAVLHASAINLYGELKKSRFYSFMIGERYRKIMLSFAGNILTIYFVSIVFILVAVHDFKKASDILLSLF